MIIKLRNYLFSLSILTFFHSFSQPVISLTPFATGLTQPLCITNAGDSRMFVAGKAGQIWVIDSLGNLNPKPFLDISSEVGSMKGEQGLLGLAFSPNYKNDGYFFVNYTAPDSNTHISRFSVSLTNPDSALASSEKLLLMVTQPFSNHNGGSTYFGPDGYLYLGLGDGGGAGDPYGNAQNKKKYLGKILRIDPLNGNPYAIPASNPFIGDTSALPELWCIGLRNPWRFSFDRYTNDLWIADVGQNAWEEIDFQRAGPAGGQNYGWHCYEGAAAYNTTGCLPFSAYNPPVYTYSHTDGCSVTGGYVYRGSEEGDLYGRYLFTDYCSGQFWSTMPDSAGGWKTDKLNVLSTFQYTSFGENNKGELFVTEITSGRVMKVGTSACLPTAHILAADTVPLCGSLLLKAVEGNGFTYQWKLNGNDISGADSSSHRVTSAGDHSVVVTNSSLCSNTSNKVHVSPCTGIQDISSQLAIRLYPNPSKGTINIEFNSAHTGKVEVKIVNAMGQEILREEKELNSGTNSYTLQAGRLSTGFYFVHINTAYGFEVRKLVVE